MLIPSLTSAITVPAESYKLVQNDNVADVTNNDMKSDINRGPGDIKGDVKNGDVVDKIYVERVVDTKNLNSSSVKVVIPPLNPASGAIPTLTVPAESHELMQSHKDNVTNDDIGSEGANHITREENRSCSNDVRNDDTSDTARDMGDTSGDRSDDSEKVVDSTKLNLNTVTQKVLIPPVDDKSGVPPLTTARSGSYNLVQNHADVTDMSNNHTADGDVLNAFGACGDAVGDSDGDAVGVVVGDICGDAHDDVCDDESDDTHDDSSNTVTAYGGSDKNDDALDGLGNGELVDTFDDAVGDTHDDTSDDEVDDENYDDSCDDTGDILDDGDAFYSSLLQL